ncbi:N-acetyltransferase [Corallococcus praedator]|uniref:N-acetyltransferase n=1 Tax=Corallococcus praedator TaxID=2316724 RepID=A0ABX9QH17_9BACT|nr:MULTISPECIES: GNAT family N-acetyltransferase [Corallococcus]RKH07595.1 N-acetyltransferase [Corallococcus sp. CA047B]RKH32713.1 N-acetyltransferase [Corallococcus sp. CA031C]RKI05667.1 N-acetyltransferase [Corallococcus praedator]
MNKPKAPVIPAPYTQALSREDAASGFQCEHEALNRFFRQDAGQNQRRDVSRTWVLHRPDTRPDWPRVLGYYTLSVGQVSRSEAPEDVIKRLPRYPLPAVVIGRLARDSRVRGAGVGEQLLDDAHRRALAVGENAGVVLVIVDAKDAPAERFYARFGYRPLLSSLPDAPDWPRRLFLPSSHLRASFEDDA